MKVIFSSITAFFILIVNINAFADSSQYIPKETLLEFRSSYYFPSSSKFKKVFGDDERITYQLTAAFPVYHGKNAWLKRVGLWTAVDYFSNKGSSATGDKSTIRAVPFTLGIKYFLPTFKGMLPINFYAGAGLKYYFIHTHNNGDYTRNTIDKSGLGGVWEAGFIATLFKHFVLDFFVSYSLKTFDPPSISNPSIEAAQLDISGINAGVGLGYCF